jgi:hypothetical protein
MRAEKVLMAVGSVVGALLGRVTREEVTTEKRRHGEDKIASR